MPSPTGDTISSPIEPETPSPYNRGDTPGMTARHRLSALASLAAITAAGGLSRAAPFDWAEGENGATRDYFNRAAQLAWRQKLGDWADADGIEQGDRPFGSTTADRGAAGGEIEVDVTALARALHARKFPDRGLFCRVLKGGCSFRIPSRESGDEDRLPRLRLSLGGALAEIAASADTYLEPSTYRAVGGRAKELRLGKSNPVLLRFGLGALPPEGEIGRATLILPVDKVYGTGATTIGVFRCAQGDPGPPPEARAGLAAEFPSDRGIGDHPAVIFQADFDGTNPAAGWTQFAPRESLDAVAADSGRGFEPLAGKALRVRMAEGAHTALNSLFGFARAGGPEPEEIYFRYYLRLANNWNQTESGGKMPGISGTYGRAGWGGRKSDGTDGWSARGQFFKSVPAGDNPLAGRHPIGTYCYHADMAGQYGDSWVWGRGALGLLENDRWYCIEQQIKLNTPGGKDGELRAWIDGRPAFEKTDIRFRTVAELKIEQVWMNVYHGGKEPSPREQHLYIDNVVVAREYIGPAGE